MSTGYDDDFRPKRKFKKLKNTPDEEPEKVREIKTPDDTLRANGFKIRSRPEGKEAIWTLNGEVYAESEAHRLCQEPQTGVT